jgi:hypothetical protein
MIGENQQTRNDLFCRILGENQQRRWRPAPPHQTLLELKNGFQTEHLHNPHSNKLPSSKIHVAHSRLQLARHLSPRPQSTTTITTIPHSYRHAFAYWVVQTWLLLLLVHIQICMMLPFQRLPFVRSIQNPKRRGSAQRRWWDRNRESCAPRPCKAILLSSVYHHCCAGRLS